MNVLVANTLPPGQWRIYKVVDFDDKYIDLVSEDGRHKTLCTSDYGLHVEEWLRNSLYEATDEAISWWQSLDPKKSLQSLHSSRFFVPPYV